jgi:hypothetical protein
MVTKEKQKRVVDFAGVVCYTIKCKEERDKKINKKLS